MSSNEWEDHYRELADKIIELFNPPDDDAAEIHLLMVHLERVAELIKACACYCKQNYAHPDADPDVCWRCEALGREFDKPVER